MITSNSTLFDIQVPTNMGSVYIWMNTNMESKYFELDKNNYITSLSLSLSVHSLLRYPLKIFYNEGRKYILARVGTYCRRRQYAG